MVFVLIGGWVGGWVEAYLEVPAFELSQINPSIRVRHSSTEIVASDRRAVVAREVEISAFTKALRTEEGVVPRKSGWVGGWVDERGAFSQ